MNISHIFIVRPVMTTLLMAGLVIFGVFGYMTLPVSELPNIDFPTIFVQANLPGADPETMASAVATPLEGAMSTIPGVDTMTSNSGQGFTGIAIQFKLERNIDAAAQDVQAAISSVQRRLPRAMPSPPSFRKNDPSSAPIFFISLWSNSLPIFTVDRYARTLLANQISTVDGVSQVQIQGGAKYAVRIQADPSALAARGMGLNDLATAVTQNSTNQASGTLNGPTKTTILHTAGQLVNAEQFRNQIIAYRDGFPVKLGDVANVIDSVENTRSADWLGTQRAVTLQVSRQPGSNTIAVADNIRSLLPRFQAALPKAIQMRIVYDRSQTIRAAVNDVQMTLIIAGTLVVGVIFVFLRRVTATVIPSLALPIAVLGTFAGMSLLGFNLDNLSLMALTLSVGFVVDDAIVMLENIVRHIEAGEQPYEAAMKGSAEIGFTILSMTVSLAAVFIPIVFMTGIIGRLLHEFALVIIVAIMCSGLVSVTLTPMLCARVLKDEHSFKQNAFQRWAERSFNYLEAAYDRSLRWALSHRRAVLGIFFASVAASLVLFEIMPADFLPSDDAGQLRGSVQTATGTAFDQSVKYVRQVMAFVQKNPSVQSVQAGEFGDMSIVLKPLDQRALSADQVANELRRETRNVPGTQVTIVNPPSIRMGGRGARASYQYTLQGLDFEQLLATSQRLVAAMKEDPVFVGVNSDQDRAAPALQVDIDRNRAAALGITPDALENVTGVAFGGQQVSQIYESVDQYQVVLELLPQYQQDPSALDRIYLSSKAGQMVPLSSVVRTSRSTMVQRINHAGQVPSVTVSFDLARGYALSDAVTHVTRATEQVGMPPAVSGAFAGTAAAFQSSTGNMDMLMLIALIVVYIILGVLYESFIHPFTILSGLPSAAAGALLTLYIFGLPLTIYAYVGMMMLIGIVKKNAIMMIDFALQKKRSGEVTAPEEAIYQAAMIRFRPIMMTTMAAMMGTLPIALGTGMGADSRRPLGLCVAGGLLLSQLLTLYITPVIYIYLDKLADNFSFRGLWTRFFYSSTTPAAPAE